MSFVLALKGLNFGLVEVNRQIEDWEEGGSEYWSGIDLLESLGGDPFIIKLCKRQKSSFGLQNIRDAFKELTKVKEPLKQTKPKPVVVRARHRLDDDHLPGSVSRLEQLKKDLFAEAAECKVLLGESRDTAKRYEFAERIIKNQKALFEIWGQLDDFYHHGRLPSNKKLLTAKERVEQIEIIDLQKSLSNSRSLISKYRKSLLTVEGAKAVNYHLKLSEQEEMKKELLLRIEHLKS